MAFTRRNKGAPFDITYNRAWNAATVGDLPTGAPAAHGDVCLVASDGLWRAFMDDGTWQVFFAGGTAGQVLTSGGAAFPTFQNSVLTIAKAHNSAVQSIPNAVQTPLTFDTNDIAVGDAMHSTSVNNSRFTALTEGVYLLNGSVLINALVNGLAIIQVRKNGTTILASVTGTLNTSSSVLCPIFIFDIAATNDYYEFLAFQNTGGAQNTDNTASSTFGAAIRISN